MYFRASVASLSQKVIACSAFIFGQRFLVTGKKSQYRPNPGLGTDNGFNHLVLSFADSTKVQCYDGNTMS